MIDVLTSAAEDSGVRIQSQTYAVNPNARLAIKTPQELNERDTELGELEKRVEQMTGSVKVLERRLDDLQEFRSVLLQVSPILKSSGGQFFSEKEKVAALDEEAATTSNGNANAPQDKKENSFNFDAGLKRTQSIDTFPGGNGVKFGMNYFKNN